MSKHQAFIQWYQPIHEPFIRYCSSKAIGWMETEDLAQETILATLERFEQIKDKKRLLGYMIGVVNNLVGKQYRRAKFQTEWDEKVLEKLESRTKNPEIALDLQYLLKAMNQLPHTQKEAIELFELSGFSIAEVADIQEVSIGAVKTRISRGRKTLRSLLQDEDKKMPLSQRLAIYASILF
jgi:RNA polymerase sigma-70 factor (ECF subfamily)